MIDPTCRFSMRRYVRVNVWRDWGAEATTTFGVAPVPLVEHLPASNRPGNCVRCSRLPISPENIKNAPDRRRHPIPAIIRLHRWVEAA
jgi:hypothetical protein